MLLELANVVRIDEDRIRDSFFFLAESILHPRNKKQKTNCIKTQQYSGRLPHFTNLPRCIYFRKKPTIHTRREYIPDAIYFETLPPIVSRSLNRTLNTTL